MKKKSNFSKIAVIGLSYIGPAIGTGLADFGGGGNSKFKGYFTRYIFYDTINI